MASHRQGEMDVELNGISYTMKIDMGVIDEWDSSTGKDFISTAIAATSAYHDSISCEKRIQACEMLSYAVTRSDAAWLFYLAAKNTNSRVEMGEIQEAILDDLDLSDDNKFYPSIFVRLAGFAIAGNLKKKT